METKPTLSKIIDSITQIIVVCSIIVGINKCSSNSNDDGDGCKYRIVGIGTDDDGAEAYHCEKYTEANGCISFYSKHDSKTVKLCGSYSIAKFQKDHE